ncbi:hypothetical protein BGX24_003471 [Mortierella sp. AD032]|nr:hypothetical protein BGX24_003471 [Mortierella sp. AD032]
MPQMPQMPQSPPSVPRTRFLRGEHSSSEEDHPKEQRNPTGPLVDFGEQLPLAVSNDLKMVTYFGVNNLRMTWAELDDSWRPGMDPICPITSTVAAAIPSTQGGRVTLTDSSTGVMYIPHGAENGTQMLVYNNGVCSGSTMPANTIGVYSAWNQAKGAVYMLGTTVATSNPPVPVLWQFSIATANWTSITVQGDPVSVLTGSCMVTAGSKVLVFGGNSGSDPISGNIYIFDTATSIWKKGATSTKGSTQMVCATGGDFLVAWGGYDDKATLNDMLFYNIKTDKWIDPSSYSGDGGSGSSGSISNPSTSNGTGPNSTGTPSTDMSTSNSNAAMIGGIAAGVIVAVAIAGFVIFRRRHHGRKAGPDKRQHQQDDDMRLESLSFPDKSDESLLSRPTHLDPDPTKAMNVPHAVQDFNYKTENLDEGKLSEQQPSNSPQYIETLLPRTPDYAQLQQELAQMPPIVRIPQGQIQNHGASPATARTSLPEQLALVQARHEETLERIRLEQRADLQRMRQEWESHHSP